MLVGDIYGERDYTSIGLSATTIASSFGKVNHLLPDVARAPQLAWSVWHGVATLFMGGTEAGPTPSLLLHVVRAPHPL